MEVVVDGEAMKVDVCNVIPGQQAGHIAALAGITNEAGWAPVVPHTMQSRADENIHVLGDASQQGDMPKSGFSANSQAKVCAMAVRGALTDSKVFPARFSNTCWSLIGTDDGVKVGRLLRAHRREDRQDRRLHLQGRGKAQTSARRPTRSLSAGTPRFPETCSAERLCWRRLRSGADTPPRLPGTGPDCG